MRRTCRSKMEDLHRKAIRANYVILSKDLELELVMPSLIQDGIYEPFMSDTFKAKGGKLAQNQALLNSIETRGPKAYKAFISALTSAGQGHLAEAIRKKETTQPSTKPSEQHYEPMQTESLVSQPTDAGVWPNPGIPAVLEQYHIPKVPVKTEMVDSNEVYRMSSNPRGLALIINNMKFRTMPERRGTEVDGRNLHHVFKELGFNVDTKTNVKGQEMATFIREFAKMNHSTFDCVILAILTHGVEGALYGVDEKKLAVEDVFKYFDATRAPTLIGKPKIVILQACRGERFDKGVESTDATGAGYVEETAPPPRENGDQDANALVDSMLRLEFEAPDAFASARSKVPSMSDMLIAYATVPGYVSWRNSERGSWFIQALTEVILEYSQSEDLLSMLTKVNSKVAKAFESSSGKNKQMPAPVTMLTKKLFFFPGYVRK
ncbi:caspase-3-like isoform X1 [Apostichopus japonicus]|uniref:caspase-3-like isoform X1 n=2 Tax=Stichopus japonicus TaxID=307972 RepID=UPI003AB3DCA4